MDRTEVPLTILQKIQAAFEEAILDSYVCVCLEEEYGKTGGRKRRTCG
jgi:hypothetical protein